MPTERMGPPPGASPPMRMLHHGQDQTTLPYTSLWHEDAPQWRAPLGSSTDRQAPSDAEAMQKAPVAIHHRSACSANLIPGDGTKNGLSRSEQKTVSTTQNNRLTGKAPYKSTANLALASRERSRSFKLQTADALTGAAAGPLAVSALSMSSIVRQRVSKPEEFSFPIFSSVPEMLARTKPRHLSGSACPAIKDLL